MTSQEEFRKYRSAAHKPKINIHCRTYNHFPGFTFRFALDCQDEMKNVPLPELFKSINICRKVERARAGIFESPTPSYNNKNKGVKEFHMLAGIGCYCKIMVFHLFKFEIIYYHSSKCNKFLTLPKGWG